MTQDQHGQGQGTGSAVRGEVIRDDQAEESPAQAMTRFQKVASALRGDKPDEEEASTAPDENGTAAPPPENGTAAPPEGTARSDYWDDEASPVAVTRPDGLGPDAAEPRGGPGAAAGAAGAGTATGDHSETQPDIFGTTARPDPGEAPAAPEAVTPEAPAAGRHAAAPGNGGPRPGEATDAVGDFSDIAYGNLIPEAAEFRQQWHQIQFKFVDDPKASVTEAADIVAQVTARLEAAIQERQRVITERQRSLRSTWAEGSNADTETLRGTLRMYRAFLDQLLGSRASY